MVLAPTGTVACAHHASVHLREALVLAHEEAFLEHGLLAVVLELLPEVGKLLLVLLALLHGEDHAFLKVLLDIVGDGLDAGRLAADSKRGH